MLDLSRALTHTDFSFPGLREKYTGKVRDVYRFRDDTLILVTTDRTSAFDAPLSLPIPYKGEILNRIAAHFLRMAGDIVPTWYDAMPDPAASAGRYHRPLPIEFIVRHYLCGHALRHYQAGHRTLAGQPLPEGLQPYDRLPRPILTPTIKATTGHDEDITPAEIVRTGIVDEATWQRLEQAALMLFRQGSEYARSRKLILADTKYEFALSTDGRPVLIDEVHTPDSSRYFYEDDYQAARAEGRPPRQLSKEFIRQWLLRQGMVTPGRHYDVIPVTEEVAEQLLQQYLTVYEALMGRPFEFSDRTDLPGRIERNIATYLAATSKTAR